MTVEFLIQFPMGACFTMATKANTTLMRELNMAMLEEYLTYKLEDEFSSFKEIQTEQNEVEWCQNKISSEDFNIYRLEDFYMLWCTYSFGVAVGFLSWFLRISRRKIYRKLKIYEYFGIRATANQAVTNRMKVTMSIWSSFSSIFTLSCAMIRKKKTSSRLKKVKGHFGEEKVNSSYCQTLKFTEEAQKAKRTDMEMISLVEDTLNQIEFSRQDYTLNSATFNKKGQSNCSPLFKSVSLGTLSSKMKQESEKEASLPVSQAKSQFHPNSKPKSFASSVKNKLKGVSFANALKIKTSSKVHLKRFLPLASYYFTNNISDSLENFLSLQHESLRRVEPLTLVKTSWGKKKIFYKIKNADKKGGRIKGFFQSVFLPKEYNKRRKGERVPKKFMKKVSGFYKSKMMLVFKNEFQLNEQIITNFKKKNPKALESLEGLLSQNEGFFSKFEKITSAFVFLKSRLKRKELIQDYKRWQAINSKLMAKNAKKEGKPRERMVTSIGENVVSNAHLLEVTRSVHPAKSVGFQA